MKNKRLIKNEEDDITKINQKDEITLMQFKKHLFIITQNINLHKLNSLKHSL